MKGSGAPGKRRRAAPISPPRKGGSSPTPKGIMSAALALVAMVIELCLGYPQPLLRAIGHPVTWIGALIAVLDRTLNPPPFPPPLGGEEREGARRLSGIIAVLIVLGIVGSIAFVIAHVLLRIPFG